MWNQFIFPVSTNELTREEGRFSFVSLILLTWLEQIRKSYLTFRKCVRQNNPNVPLRKQTKKKLLKNMGETDLKELIRSKSAQENMRILTCCPKAVTSGLICMHRITRVLPKITRGDKGGEQMLTDTHAVSLVRKQKQVQDIFNMSEGNLPPRCRNPPQCSPGGPYPSPRQAGCWAAVVCAQRGRLTSYLWRQGNVNTETANSNTLQQDS